MTLVELSVSDLAAEAARPLDLEGLYAEAQGVVDRAYAPYSGLRVGAALLEKGGEVITGANVENGSYGLTICAERAAVVRAVAQGHSDFLAIAVAGADPRVRTLACCGACLQVLAEFDRGQSLVVLFPDDGLLRIALLAELLPTRFSLSS